MAALLQLLQITTAAKTNPTVPATTYYFIGSSNIYTGDIATATAVEISATNLEGEVPRVAVKELLLAGCLKTIDVEVTLSSKVYRKKLRYCATADATVQGALIGKSWPSGKQQGGTISAVIEPRRVTSRK